MTSPSVSRAQSTPSARQFVGFYDANPHFKESWNLEAESVAVIGVGNVALDIARVLAKTGDELRVTEIPDNVYESLKENKAKEVHVFGRRGSASQVHPTGTQGTQLLGHDRGHRQPRGHPVRRRV